MYISPFVCHHRFNRSLFGVCGGEAGEKSHSKNIPDNFLLPIPKHLPGTARRHYSFLQDPLPCIALARFKMFFLPGLSDCYLT